MKTNNNKTTFLLLFSMATLFLSCKKEPLVDELELLLQSFGCESWIVPDELQEDDNLHPTFYKARLCDGGTQEGRIIKGKEISICVKKSNSVEGSSRANILTVVSGYAGVTYMPLNAKYNYTGACGVIVK